MAARQLFVAFSFIAAAAPLPAAAQAPAGTADTRYCLRVEALTGSNIERTLCRTREQWWAQGVDVDKEWPAEGVRTIG